MPALEYIRLVPAPLPEVAEELPRILLEHGYVPEPPEPNSSWDGVKVCASDPHPSFFRFLRTGQPQRVTADCTPLANALTKAVLRTEILTTFQRGRGTILALLLLLMFGCICCIVFEEKRKTLDALKLSPSACILMAYSATAWLYIASKIKHPFRLLHALAGEVEGIFGFCEGIPTTSGPAPGLIFAGLSAAFCIFCFPLFVALHFPSYRPQFIVVIALLLAGAALMFAFGRTRRASVRCLYVEPILVASFAFVLYGGFPVFVACELAIVPRVLWPHLIPQCDNTLTTLLFTLLTLSLFGIVTLAPLAWLYSSIASSVEALRTSKAFLELPFSITHRDSMRFGAFLVAFWFLLFGLQLYVVYLSSCLIGICLFNSKVPLLAVLSVVMHAVVTSLSRSWIAYFSLPQWMNRLGDGFLLLYAATVLSIPCVLIWRNFRGLAQHFVGFFWQYSELKAHKSRFSQFTVKIAQFARVRAPALLVLNSDSVSIQALLPPLPGLKTQIVISTSAIDLLDDNQMEAIIAHEIGHLRHNHVLFFSALSFVSRWTLMGDGFFAIWMPAANELEEKADEFAVEWLDQAKGPIEGRHHLIEALRLLEAERTRIMLERQTSSLGAVGEFVSCNSVRNREMIADRTGMRVLIHGLGTHTKMLWRVYHEGWLMQYVYPPISRRIERIISLPTRIIQE